MASKKQSIAGEALGLFTDFVQGVRQGLKRKGGTDKQLESLREEHIIDAIVNLIMAPVQSILQFLDRTVSVTMDLTRTMAQLIADGKYNWVNPDIAKHFSIQPNEGSRPTELHLLWYNKVMTSDQVLADMDRQGLRPATFLELLWLGIQHPLLQPDFPIIALGTVVRVDGHRIVACLCRSVRGRCLRLYRFVFKWNECCRFAALRK